MSFSFIAHFFEVRIEPTTRRIRVPRVMSVLDCGSVISPRTARSQVEGGVVWGFGATLREVSEVDPRYGGFLNTDLAEYVLPVAADIGSIEVDFVDQPDARLKALGAKGSGEVAMVGVAPAIANAISTRPVSACGVCPPPSKPSSHPPAKPDPQTNSPPTRRAGRRQRHRAHRIARSRQSRH